jgi:hypothetical protein
MNRYLLFAGENYYTSGGTRDLIGDYPSMEIAIEALGEIKHANWFNILDTETGNIFDHHYIGNWNDLQRWAKEYDKENL